MKKIMLISKGRYSCKSKSVTPETLEELKKEVVGIAHGYHYFDSVIGIVYDDSDYDSEAPEDVFAFENEQYKSGNMLFVGGNCDNGLEYREETDDFIDKNGEVFSTKDEACEAYTIADYGDDISSLFNEYKR